MEAQYKKVLENWVKNFEGQLKHPAYGVKIRLNYDSKAYNHIPEVTWTDYVNSGKDEFPSVSLKEKMNTSDGKGAVFFNEEYNKMWTLLNALNPNGKRLQMVDAGLFDLFIVDINTFEAVKTDRIANRKEVLHFALDIFDAQENHSNHKKITQEEIDAKTREYWQQGLKENINEPLAKIIYL